MTKKTTYSVLTIFTILSLSFIFQDCYASQWAKTYGGSDSDLAYTIQQTSDGGYIAVGQTDSFGIDANNTLVLKLNKSGNVSWAKSYSGSIFAARLIQQTVDGGYVLAGQDSTIVKLDSSGNIIWQKSYGSSMPRAIQQTKDGGFIVTCNSTGFGPGGSDIGVFNIDSNGNLLWQKAYGETNADVPSSIQQTSDGGYIVAGETNSFGTGNPTDMWILKLDSSGTILWQKTYGGTSSDKAYAIQQTEDGGYIVLAGSGSFGSVWILKLNSNGGIIWQKSFEKNTNSSPLFFKQTSDGGYIVGGYRFVSSTVGWLLKLDKSGHIAWQKTYGGTAIDVANSIQQTSDGGYVVAGYTYSFGAADSDFWILKIDSNGEINNCPISELSALPVTDTTVIGQDTNAIISPGPTTVINTTLISQNETPAVLTQCFAHDWFSIEPPTQDKLNGVWGYISSTATHEFYAVGEDGTIMHFDGTSWSGTGSPTSVHLNGIWGSSETDIYAVGDNGTIVHYPDQLDEWEHMSHSLPPTNLKDIWGSSASDIYAVGEGGFIAHYNGSTWSEVTITPVIYEKPSPGIWGSASDKYVVVGTGGTILTYNGISWTEVSLSPTHTRPLRSLRECIR